MPDYIRQIVREPRFEYELRALIGEAIAADEFVEAAEFLIARDPLSGSHTEDPRVWAMPIALVEGRQIVLYYAFDDTTV